MNILFIGGSNLVLTQGISAKLPRLLEAAGLHIESSTNIAVGGTGSLFGLENLTTYVGHQHDLVFIEYGINDLPTFSRDRFLWEQGFKGLLKLTRRRFPKALVITLLLGRRDERFWSTQTKMHAEMTRLSRECGAHVINMDAEFKKEAFQKLPFASLYLDESHYQEPLVTGYISQQCALQCLGLIHAHGELAHDDSSSVATLTHADLTLHVTPMPGQIRTFSNSRFSRQTTVLTRDSSLAIDVPGTPVGLSFVSARDSCSVHVAMNGQSRILNTLHREIRSNRFKGEFIVKHVPLPGAWMPDIAPPESTRVELHVIDSKSTFWNESLVQKTYGMEQPDERGAAFYLCAISSFVPNGY